MSSSSDDASGGSGLRTLIVYGLDQDYNLQEEIITLNGTTPVTTSGTYIRVFRLKGLTAGNGETNAGLITARQSPTTSNVFCTIPVGNGQSQFCGYTVPAGHTAYLKKYAAYIFDTNANRAELTIRVRDFGGVWRQIRPFTISTEYSLVHEPYGGTVFEEKTDIIMRMTVLDNTNASIAGKMDILLVAS